MTRYRDREVSIPVFVSSGGNSGGSGVKVIFTAVVVLLGLLILIAVLVSCTDFGPGATVPKGPGCYPFACTSTVVTPEVTR